MKKLVLGILFLGMVLVISGCNIQKSGIGEIPVKKVGGGGGGGDDPVEDETYCGDGNCDSNETCATCETDCGECSLCDVFPTVQINEDSQGNNYTYPGYRSLDDNLDGILTGSEFCSSACSFSELVVEYVTPYGEMATSKLLACDEGIEYGLFIDNWDEVLEEMGAVHWIKMDTMCCGEKDVLDMFEEDCLLTFSGLYNSTPVDVKEVCDFYNDENGEQTKCVFGQWMAQDGRILPCNYELSPDEDVHTMCCSI